MKLLTWNCNGAFRKKFKALSRFDADLLIIQECEDPARSTPEYRTWSENYLWIGNNKNKGLGIFVKPDIALTALNWSDNGLQMFLPCRVNDSFNLVGVWTKAPDTPKNNYIGQLWKYLQLNKALFKSEKTVLGGDFNSNTIWDSKHKGCSHSDVVRELAELQIKSIYHETFKEEHGHELLATQYMYRNPEKAYHLDYAFLTTSLIDKNKSVFVGGTEEWLQHSDHMPLVFSIKS